MFHALNKAVCEDASKRASALRQLDIGLGRTTTLNTHFSISGMKNNYMNFKKTNTLRNDINHSESTRIALLFLVAVSSFPNMARADISLTYNLDLSSGSLVNSRQANGYLTAVSPSSVTLIGSDGGYYPGTNTSLTFQGALDAGKNFSGSPMPTYLGIIKENLALTLPLISWEAVKNSVPTEVLNSYLGYLAFDVSYYELRYSYDYSWVTQDTPGYDSPSGTDLPSLSNMKMKSGHVEIAFQAYEYVPSDILWSIYSFDNVGGAGSLTISNFIVDVAQKQVTRVVMVPEPESYAMMLVGIGMVGFMPRRRKQAKV